MEMNLKGHLLVLLTVLITISTSLILRFAADRYEYIDFFVIIIVISVMVINVIKFILWGLIHKRYQLNKSYPITVLFFPAIFLISYLLGETEPTLTKIIGIVIIVTGLIIYEN